MKIEINIPDQVSELTEKGLLNFARRINPKFKTEKKGKEFFEEFFQMFADAAYESVDPDLIKAKQDARKALSEAQKASKEKLNSLK
jgi:hypothetical protein